ncbi:hypothetical protein HYH03_016839 [Edaphochlamys debaryana]|uniref:Phosphoribulokinase/uridine kinase domain-containing protein n=1 Tax=Edaphochlamys debaryana TaxID=47281 RepID=A0A835XHP1_9CHLO|nr:hypothetical protein HYH03_016839 [Edaphochlamys debaryana]|eukprot:KAG2484293.1 hypothetical protein HYH03_016839 [Edaphochlamys debaryana]
MQQHQRAAFLQAGFGKARLAHGACLRRSAPRRPALTCRAQQVVSGSCYEDIIESLADRALRGADASGRRRIIGIAGGPGSGKSTLALAVVASLNARRPGSAAVLPMDGFHYYRRELDAMSDPKEAHARRGAPWTFDAAKFVGAVARVRGAGAGEVVRVPSFDHGVGDPVEADIAIPAEAAVVVVEGNYVLLPDAPWSSLLPLLDEAWFVDCPLDTAMERVFQRQTGIGLAPEVSRVRIATNDRPNAELIAASKHRATLLVPSTVPFRSGRGAAA